MVSWRPRNKRSVMVLSSRCHGPRFSVTLLLVKYRLWILLCPDGPLKNMEPTGGLSLGFGLGENY